VNFNSVNNSNDTQIEKMMTSHARSEPQVPNLHIEESSVWKVERSG